MEDAKPPSNLIKPIVGSSLTPVFIQQAGARASKRYVEFFTAQIRNKGTRTAYAQAVNQFFAWCEDVGVSFEQIEPVIIATYIESLVNEQINLTLLRAFGFDPAVR